MSEDSNSSVELMPSVLNHHNEQNVTLNGHYQHRNTGKPEGPYLEIIEQPKSRGFRFRYACEGKSHGGLQGENSDKHKKTFPSVRIHNYKGVARIVVKLVTDEAKPRPHAHELIGKNCTNGTCVLEVKPEKTQTEIIFSNLGILHVTKKRVPEILTTRIMEDMKVEKMSSDTLNNIDISHIELTEEGKKKAKRQATEQAKNMSLNVVRLCFQVYLADQNGLFTRILESVVSNPIFDCKSPGAAALKICRMDRHSGFCTGQEEVFLLCDKVQKEDIAIRFFELGEDDNVKWEAYGSFGPADVHRQYAIVFRTPPYIDTEIDKPVNVYVQLKRLGDGEMSDPKTFSYIPVQRDQDDIIKKKMKTLPDFSLGAAYAGQAVTVVTQPVVNGFMQAYQVAAQAQMVNGNDVAYQIAPQNQVLYNGSSNGVSLNNFQPQQVFHDQPNPAIAHSPPGHAPMMPHNQMNGQQMYQMTPRGCAPSQPIDLSKDHVKQNGLPGSNFEEIRQSKLAKIKARKADDLETDSCPITDDDIDVVDSAPRMDFPHCTSIGLQKLDSGYKSYNPSVSLSESATRVNPSVSLSDPTTTVEVIAEPVSTSSEEIVKAAGSCTSYQTFTEDNNITSVHIEECETIEVMPLEMDKQPVQNEICVEVEAIEEEQTVEVIPVQTQQAPEAENMETLAWRVAENTAVALQHFAKTGNVAYILLIQRHLVAVQDENGDNGLHMAVIHRRAEPLRHLLLAASTLNDNVAVNAFNSLQQTPLHLAVITNQPEMIELLVQHNADVSLVDRNGNTAAHLATINGYDRCLQALLATSLTLNGPMLSLNQLNYDGLSPLHLAVRRGNLKCARHLVLANANINLADGKGGYTALHHAVETENLGIVGYLLLEAASDPNIPTYSGNSALHIAVGRDLISIAALLVASGADPEVENTEPPSADSEEEGGVQRQESADQEMYEEGITPMDLAQGNERMLRILRGESYSMVSESSSHHTQAHTISLYSGLIDSGLGLMSQDTPGDLEKLDLVTRVKLARLLDQTEGEGWESLARHVGLTSLIDALRPMRSPTRAVLDNLEVLEGTISKLKEALLKMRRLDAIEVIDEGLSLNEQAAREMSERRAKDPMGYSYQNYMIESQLGNLSLRSQKEQ